MTPPCLSLIPRLVNPRGRRLTFLITIMSVSPGLLPTCKAELVFEAPQLSAAAGSTGTFELLLTNAGLAGDPIFHVAADTFRFSITGTPGVTFTGVTIATTTPYLFATSATTLGAGPLSLDTFPNATFLASDAEFAPQGFRALSPGDAFGIAEVSYSVDPGAVAGPRTLGFGPGTSLSDENSNSLAFGTTAGTFDVTPISVPEPSTWLLTMIGGATCYLRRRASKPGETDLMR